MLLHGCVLSHYFLSDSVTPQAAARQAPLSVRFSRQGYWLPFISTQVGPHLGVAPSLPALAGGSFPIEPPRTSKYASKYDFFQLLGFKKCLWLCQVSIAAPGIFQLCHVASSSLTRSQSRSSYLRTSEPQPLDHQGSPQRDAFVSSLYFIDVP